MSKKTRNKSSVKAAGKTSAEPSRPCPGKPTSQSPQPISAKNSPASSHVKPDRKAGLTEKSASSAQKRSEKAAHPRELQEGQPAPAFDLMRDGGQRLKLQDFAGRNLVLFFYPRASTPGCTKEAMDFSRLIKAFHASNTAVAGISADSVKAQESFQKKYLLELPLLSDEKKDILEAFGVWKEKSLYGRCFMGIVRTTLLMDSNGTIARIWRNVKVEGHADQVLAAAKSLGK